MAFSKFQNVPSTQTEVTPYLKTYFYLIVSYFFLRLDILRIANFVLNVEPKIVWDMEDTTVAVFIINLIIHATIFVLILLLILSSLKIINTFYMKYKFILKNT